MKEISSVQKACGFYISNMHFATMILPFVNKQLEENTKITTFFENDFTINIELVLSKLKITEERKRELLDVNWKNKNILKYLTTEKILKNSLDKKRNNLILINGRDNYINNINDAIDKYMQKNMKKFKNLKIMDFYEVGNFNENVTEILDKHELLFNTAGEHKIEEIFEGYKRVEVNI